MAPGTESRKREQNPKEQLEKKVRKISSEHQLGKSPSNSKFQSGTPTWLCNWYDVKGQEKENY